MASVLPPYALIIAEVVDRRGGDVRVRLVADSGEPIEIWIDDSSITPLTDDQAAKIAEEWKIGLPG
jgi:hypothetical protein